MGSLGTHADPDGWLNAGGPHQDADGHLLDSELYDTDRIGGAGLSAHPGACPAAEAFTGNWSGAARTPRT